VLIIERWLLGRLRHRRFYSLAELNATQAHMDERRLGLWVLLPLGLVQAIEKDRSQVSFLGCHERPFIRGNRRCPSGSSTRIVVARKATAM
jgi:hypothetical protein